MSKELTKKTFDAAIGRILKLSDAKRRLKACIDAISLELDSLDYETKAFALQHPDVYSKVGKKMSIGITEDAVFKVSFDWTFERTEINRKTGEAKKLDDSAWLKKLLANEATKDYVRTKYEFNKSKLREEITGDNIPDEEKLEILDKLAVAKTPTSSLTVCKLADMDKLEEELAAAEMLADEGEED
ncbi:MAG: hypothetical protein K6F50_09900 [Kiritimatiellae bacterium]|nr:hypothetical protein [Kiritimatiellia bacterium]